MDQLEINLAHLQYQVHLLESENRRTRDTLRRQEQQIKHLFDMIQELQLDANGDVRPCDR